MSLSFSFQPFPELSTDRLLLRRCTAADIPALFRLRSDPAVMQYVARPRCQTEEDAARVFQMMEDKIDNNTGINWAIARPADPAVFIGLIGLFRLDTEHHRGELGYMLLPEYWGQGFVSELIPVVMRYGFEGLQLHSIEAAIEPENHASRRVLEKNGFVQEAYFRENWYFEGRFLNSVVLSALHPLSGRQA